VKDGKLQVLDLREPDPKPIAIIAGIPDDQGYEIYTDDGEVNMAGNGLMQLRWVASDDGSEDPTLDVDRYMTFTGVEDWDHPPARIARIVKQAEKAKFTPAGPVWLKKEAKRSNRDSASGRLIPYNLAEDRLELPEEQCQGLPACGQATKFGKTGQSILVTGQKCDGNGCKLSCVLYDAKGARFANLAAPTEWTKKKPTAKMSTRCAVDFSTDGDVWITGGAVCTTAGCKSGDPALGWLDRGDLLDDNNY
jgi:hypothetical protein